MRRIAFMAWLAATLLLSAGCATYETWVMDPATGQLVLVGKGSTNGAFRDIVVTRVYDKDTGKLVQETIAGTSTTANILGVINQLIGTLADVGAKFKP